MKVTKKQLKRIILEEKRKLMSEGMQQQDEALYNAIGQYVMALLDSFEKWGYDSNQEDFKAEVYNFVDGYFQEKEY